MIVFLETLVRLAAWFMLAPLLPGLINRVKALVAGRRGPPCRRLCRSRLTVPVPS